MKDGKQTAPMYDYIQKGNSVNWKSKAQPVHMYIDKCWKCFNVSAGIIKTNQFIAFLISSVNLHME